MVSFDPSLSPGFDETLRESRLLAIVRGDQPDAIRATVDTLFDAGVRLVEVSITGGTALRVISSLVGGVPEGCLLGAGTVRTEADVAGVGEAGGQFVVTPALTDAVPAAVGAGLPVLAGGLTPTEIETALEIGATAVKLFPASLGGPAYLSALRQPFPDVPLVPVGGVGVAEAKDYLARGAIAVGVGSPLVGDAASGGDLGALAERAKRFLEAVA
jgi:2-dehydro-3-deoxyphosphogluconate aldolase/(4S)-4-hydroxy-2-oxoglutarate aldolase